MMPPATVGSPSRARRPAPQPKDSHRLLWEWQCGRHCVFCTRRRDHSDGRTLAEVEPDLRAARARGSEGLIITGGEPTQNPGLVALVEKARELGFSSIVLETNGARVDEALAEALKGAGLTAIEVLFPSARPELHLAMTRDPQALALATRAMVACAAAGIETWARIPLIPVSVQNAPETIGWLARKVPGISGVILDWISPRTLKAPAAQWARPALLRRYHDAAIAAAAEGGILLRLDGEDGAPACLMPARAQTQAQEMVERYRRVAVGRGGAEYRHVEPCGRCPEKSSCPGFHESLLALVTPADLVLPLRRLSVLPAEPQGRAESPPESSFNLTPNAPNESTSAVVRVNFRCQMTCNFCFVDLHGGERTTEDLNTEVRATYEAGARELCLSGGEPTLHHELPAVIAFAREIGYPMITLQTNAMLLKDASRVKALAEAGLTHSFTSLHAWDPALSDRITGVPGGFQKTIAGIAEQCRHGIVVLINFVITPDNLDQVAGFPHFLHQAFGALENRPALNISVAQPINQIVKPESVPRFSALKGPLRACLDACEGYGIKVLDVGGMCGVPACVLDGDTRYFPRESSGSRSNAPTMFTRVAACAECVYKDNCVGVRHAYVALFGEDEFQPVRA